MYLKYKERNLQLNQFLSISLSVTKACIILSIFHSSLMIVTDSKTDRKSSRDDCCTRDRDRQMENPCGKIADRLWLVGLESYEIHCVHKKLISLYFGHNYLKFSSNSISKVSFKICSVWGFQNWPYFWNLAK